MNKFIALLGLLLFIPFISAENYWTRAPIVNSITINNTILYLNTTQLENLMNNYYNKSETYSAAEITAFLNLKLDKTDQRYNETFMILSVNTSDNIESLGFYTESESDSLFYSSSNPSNYISESFGNNTYVPLHESAVLDGDNYLFVNNVTIGN